METWLFGWFVIFVLILIVCISVYVACRCGWCEGFNCFFVSLFLLWIAVSLLPTRGVEC